MFPRTGCSKLNLREISRKTGINLGMFPYYFKTKEIFTRAVLQDFYEEFFQNFSIDSKGSDLLPLDHLKTVLLRVALFVRENQDFMSSLLADVMNGEKVALEFVQANFFRHFEVMIKLIDNCKRAKAIKNIPSAEAMSFIMPSIMGPIMLNAKMRALKNKKFIKNVKLKMFEEMSSEQAIVRRVDMALSALIRETKGGGYGA
jgi:AcrR family transcriptional regulator